MLELDVIPERSLGYSGNTISGGTWEFILGLFIESYIFFVFRYQNKTNF